MIRYPDGTEVKKGDQVLLDGELSTVKSVIDSQGTLKEWGLDEHGLMLANASHGLVFIADWAPEELVFVERSTDSSKPSNETPRQ